MRNKIKIPWPVVACALFVFIFTNLFSRFIFLHIPRVHDEIDYLFQAKIFKSGKLYAPSPCAKESFDFPHMVNNGKWYSQYTPGYPLLLLLGLFIGAPWIINPLLASLSIILFFFIGKEIYDYRIGVLTSVLGSVSIWFLLMSSTMMSHTSGLFFVSLFLLFLFRSIKNPSIANGLLAGLGLGMAFLIRTYNVMLISIPFLLYFGVKLILDFKKRLKNALAFGFIFLSFIAVLLAYNQLTNGNPLRMGYVACYGENHSIGFGRAGYTGIPHNQFLGSYKIGQSLRALNKDLFGWPFSSLLALLPLLGMAWIDKEKREKDLLLAASFSALALGLHFYWGVHVFIGPRMFFEAIPVLFLLSAHGIAEIPQLLSLKLKRLKTSYIKKVLAGVLVVFTAFAFFVRFPRWVWPPDTEWYYDGFANNFAGVTPDIHTTLNELRLEQALVIIKFLYHPFEYFPDGWWSTGFLYNDPYLKENIIYAQDKGKIFELLDCFPERKTYLYLGTLEKGMLVPLHEEGAEIIYGKPIPFKKQNEKFVELVDDPKEFFKAYSPDFEKFLINIYEQNHFSDVDVYHLLKLGSLYKEKENFEQASYYYEAALQIEKEPEARYRILNLLAGCYLKTGKSSEAKTVFARTSDRDKMEVFQVFPEKGF